MVVFETPNLFRGRRSGSGIGVSSVGRMTHDGLCGLRDSAGIMDVIGFRSLGLQCGENQQVLPFFSKRRGTVLGAINFNARVPKQYTSNRPAPLHPARATFTPRHNPPDTSTKRQNTLTPVPSVAHLRIILHDLPSLTRFSQAPNQPIRPLIGCGPE